MLLHFFNPMMCLLNLCYVAILTWRRTCLWRMSQIMFLKVMYPYSQTLHNSSDSLLGCLQHCRSEVFLDSEWEVCLWNMTFAQTWPNSLRQTSLWYGSTTVLYHKYVHNETGQSGFQTQISSKDTKLQHDLESTAPDVFMFLLVNSPPPFL